MAVRWQQKRAEHGTSRYAGRAAVALTALLCAGLGAGTAQAGPAPAFAASAASPQAVQVPEAPDDIELVAGADSSISISWEASPGATGYRVYRGTAAGGEEATPVATTTGTTYKDTDLSSTPVYFYEITAVNSAGESERSEEDASKTPPPASTGGDVAGVPSGNGTVYYGKDARLAGFDWFQTLTGWFPQVLGSSGADTPGDRAVDMAYSEGGTMTFDNVTVPTAGLYTVDWRYAFASGLFPGVTNRQMGLMVNGAVVTGTERFPVTGDFETYQHSALQVQLKAGVNSITMFAVSDHGVSRVDEMTVTPATASVPAGPTNLTAAPGNTSVALSWQPSGSGNPTSYTVYRGTKSDGEAVIPVATLGGTTTTFTDTGLRNGTAYFYNVAANNGVGVSPDSNEVSVTPAAPVTVPSAPTGPTALASNGSVALSWKPSPGATAYSVYRGTAPGAEAATAVGTSTSTTFTDSGLTNGTRYYYTVTAGNSAGTSGPSAEVSGVPTAAGGTLLSQGRPTTASSAENAGTAAPNATDGDTGTRWSSAFSDPQWLQVDLGASHSVTRVVLNWQNAYGKAYQIQTSDDGTTWTTIYSTATGPGGLEDLAVSGTGRFVRVNGTQRATVYGYSLWEFQVFGA